MLNNISWDSYWTVLTITSIVYYIFTGWFYYRHDILRQLAGKRAPAAASLTTPSFSQFIEDPILPVVHACMEEITAYLEQAAYIRLEKTELLNGLKLIAKKYPAICQSSYQAPVEKMIQFELKEKCAVALHVEEIRKLWIE